MPRKNKNSHVVINTKTNMMECQRCGDTHPMKSLEGARLDVAVAMMLGFEKSTPNAAYKFGIAIAQVDAGGVVSAKN